MIDIGYKGYSYAMASQWALCSARLLKRLITEHKVSTCIYNAKTIKRSLQIDDDSNHWEEKDKQRPANLALDRTSRVDHFKNDDKVQNENDETNKASSSIRQHIFGHDGAVQNKGKRLLYHRLPRPLHEMLTSGITICKATALSVHHAIFTMGTCFHLISIKCHSHLAIGTTN